MTGTFKGRIAVLLSGSVLAQVLPLLASPLLSRLYSPESFGQFGVYAALASILGALANLKYDHAVLLSKTASLAFHMFAVCLFATIALAVVLAAAILAIPHAWYHSRWLVIDQSFAFWLPVSLILTGLTQALLAMLFREQQYQVVAKVRVIQASVGTGLSLLAGMWMPSGALLIASTILAQGAGAALLVILRDKQRRFVAKLRWRVLYYCIARYRRFPMFTASADLVNAFTANVPMLFIGSIYGLQLAGAYAFAQRTLGSPLMLISSAFSDVYRQAAAASFSRTGDYRAEALKTFRTLLAVAVVPATVCVLAAPWVFRVLFGSDWIVAGDVAQVLALAYFSRLVFSPITFNYYLANRHREDLVLQCLNLSLTLALFFAAKSSDMAFMHVMSLYSMLLFLVYVVYGLRSLEFSRRSGL
ncbi:MAG: oligosaccharide flippase family protein [Steroidobacteraceae bacterium]